MFVWLILALGGIWLIIQLAQGQIKSPFQPVPEPTRTSTSYALEGDAQFTAGNLDKSISAYQEAVRVDPTNFKAWYELARIQTYSSSLLTTDAERSARLAEALKSAQQAVALAPDDSTAHAVLAFAMDWNSGIIEDQLQAQGLLTQADQEAVRASQLDPSNTLALAYYAEILVDEQKWTQAEQYIKQAVDRDPSLMDVHRVYAYVLEDGGEYNQAIQEYDKAIAITPKLTFLYMRAGANYRTLGFKSLNEETQTQLFGNSLTYLPKRPVSMMNFKSRTQLLIFQLRKPTPRKVNTLSRHATFRLPWVFSRPMPTFMDSWGSFTSSHAIMKDPFRHWPVQL